MKKKQKSYPARVSKYALALTLGALAEALDGALAVLRGQETSVMFQHFALNWRFGVYFSLLAAANIVIDGRGVWKYLHDGFVFSLALLAWSWGWHQHQVVAGAAVAVTGLCALLLIHRVLEEPSWSERQIIALLFVGGFVAFDLLHDIPYLAMPSLTTLQLSYFNNTVHWGGPIHWLWLPLALLGVLFCIVRGAVKQRRWQDFVLLGLFMLGGILLFVIVEPLEAQLARTNMLDPRTGALVANIGISHVVAACLLATGVRLSRPTRK